MEPSQEFEGKSLDEAVARAAAALGRQPDELKYEILDDGRKGFLGLGSRPVRIRIVVAYPGNSLDKPLPGKPAVDGNRAAGMPSEAARRGAGSRPGERRGDSGAGRQRGRGVSGPGAGQPGSKSRGSENQSQRREQGRDGRRGGGADRSRGPRGQEQGGASRQGSQGSNEKRRAAHGEADGRTAREGGRRREGRGRSEREGGGHQRPDSRSSPPVPPTQGDIPYSSQEAVRLAASQILEHMKLELRARLREREEAVVLELSGHDAPLFLENEGEALDALQHVLNKILSRDERFEKRVVVDCEGFRSKRDEEMLDKARRAADEVLTTGQAVHLDGLNPYERRLIHLEIEARKGLRTYSTGTGAIRRLTIEPTTSGEE